MKLIITLELALLFLATTFQSHNPPGWYQQTLPVNDQINDIFFLDSLKGWIVTKGNFNANDTSYILHTSDGGDNWTIQNKGRENLNGVLFLDSNSGYAVGGTNGTTLMTLYNTSNGGTNWTAMNNLTGVQIMDLFFINEDTGWVCDDNPFNGGLWKTTDGGNSWQRQLDRSFFIKRIFFINRDTGWATNNEPNAKLYRTTDGGINWQLQYNFTQQINDIHFFNAISGIAASGYNYRTTDGGFTWKLSNDGGVKLSFVDDSLGWAGSNFNKVMKTTTGGIFWFRQASPIFDNLAVAAIDSLEAWAAGTGLVHTTDGGPVAVKQDNTLIPGEFTLFQNYPNPFNPVTTFKFEISKPAFVKLIVYDVSGKLVSAIIGQKLNSGSYEEVFDAGTGNNLSSGIYFYSLIIDGKTIDTKKMILIR